MGANQPGPARLRPRPGSASHRPRSELELPLAADHPERIRDRHLKAGARSPLLRLTGSSMGTGDDRRLDLERGLDVPQLIASKYGIGSGLPENVGVPGEDPGRVGARRGPRTRPKERRGCSRRGGRAPAGTAPDLRELGRREGAELCEVGSLVTVSSRASNSSLGRARDYARLPPAALWPRRRRNGRRPRSSPCRRGNCSCPRRQRGRRTLATRRRLPRVDHDSNRAVRGGA